MKKLFVITCLVLIETLAFVSCSGYAVTVISKNATDTTFPTTTVRNVRAPAPAPWHVVSFTEQTYKIQVKVGDEFAIGMFANNPFHFMESNDQNLTKLENEKMVGYWIKHLNKYGTDWFLFKAVKAGQDEIIFQYPLEYTKLFVVSIT